jgi:hypothetical protein
MRDRVPLDLAPKITVTSVGKKGDRVQRKYGEDSNGSW